MPAIRVLVVDDSVVIRKVLCEALATDPAIEVAGSASDGTMGLAKMAILKPDLVTLDVEMPGMSGLETLVEIRKRHPKLPVIMFSTLTERGASITLDALALGASDYVAKPSNTGSLEQTRARIERDLIPKVKGLCQSISAHKSTTTATRINTIQTRIDVLTIGTSTGGPNALAEVLSKLSREFPLPIVIVQHMPPLFTRLLADRLDKQSAVHIREGIPGGVLNPGEVWIAPGDLHMTVAREGQLVSLAMNRNSPENSCRPAVDPLFRSVAQVYGQHSLAVVLTGMGSDGVRGAQQVREAGGRVIVKDEATSVVWGMLDRWLPRGSPLEHFHWMRSREKSSGTQGSEGLGARIEKVCQRAASEQRRALDGKSERMRPPGKCPVKSAEEKIMVGEALNPTLAVTGAKSESPDVVYLRIRDLVYQTCGIYHSEEKLYLLVAACKRRMKNGVRATTGKEYLELLNIATYKAAESRELLNEITIGETCLFRSQPQLNALHNVILPEIAQERAKIGLKKLKVWSAGCWTGEEPYTLAMFLMEKKEKLLKDWEFEIYATDLNDRSIETARAGIYGDYALRNTP